MLTGTQATYSKNEDKSLKFHKLIPAVFFNYAEGDTTEEKENKVKTIDSNGKDVTVKLSYTEPKMYETVDGKTVQILSKTSPEDLVSAAVDYFQSKYPDHNPLLMILDRATTGENQAIKAENKEVDEESALQKQATAMSKNFKIPYETALTMLRTTIAEARKAA